MSTPFRMLRAFNDPSLHVIAGSKTHIGKNTIALFQGSTLTDSLVRELAHERALGIKEVTEAFEFYAAIRKHVRNECIVDLCCGHGLAGLLFAVFDRKTQKVMLCDRSRPRGFELVWRAALRAAPWVEEKVSYHTGTLEEIAPRLPKGSTVLAVHACGRLTDDCLAIARDLGGPAAVLPCCRSHDGHPAPYSLRNALGDDVAYDVHRTYAMEEAGHKVRWRSIPEAITPMNRVLIAEARRETEPIHRR